MQEVAGNPNKGREGLGLTPRAIFSKATEAVRRTMILETVKEGEEGKMVVMITSLA